MPWPERQRRAIAADLRRKGKTPEQIRAFFHRHGHGGNTLMNAARKHGKGKR